MLKISQRLVTAYINAIRLSPLYIAQNVNETPVQIQICEDQNKSPKIQLMYI